MGPQVIILENFKSVIFSEQQHLGPFADDARLTSPPAAPAASE